MRFPSFWEFKRRFFSRVLKVPNDIVKSEFMLEPGCNKILFVEKTKVLGLIMDRKLTYIDHAKDINRKILGRWATICKYTNRNWRFRQNVDVRLIEVLIYTLIHYAGTVWINNQSIKEVKSA